MRSVLLYVHNLGVLQSLNDHCREKCREKKTSTIAIWFLCKVWTTIVEREIRELFFFQLIKNRIGRAHIQTTNLPVAKWACSPLDRGDPLVYTIISQPFKGWGATDKIIVKPLIFRGKFHCLVKNVKNFNFLVEHFKTAQGAVFGGHCSTKLILWNLLKILLQFKN